MNRKSTGADRKLTSVQVLEMFEKRGALLSGHFQLTSGLHSDRYLQCALVLQYPETAGELGAAIAAKFQGDEIDCVVGPAVGGIVIAHEVGRELGARVMFCEREAGSMKLRRGFAIAGNERALVVEDVTTTGGSVREVMSALEKAGAVIVGVGAIIDRSGGGIKFGVPFKPLAKLEVSTFEPRSCPLCKQGLPLSKPGSRQI
ncbi:MAG: orotate phosphoribosyltransferase [Candidatus Abyssobacteria bacterium SURF_5]|uniref:Orotate phosphoribosyltransferase n=1 Tax=Abyssobacteria bacterium (strain SURF_5) TaxID=2093360 RepID=A0A3A4NGD8_ABYX5|nr:MAG: orotate phosphoribosyltransferase [Candidatus Abyssubacteria bacterium SURF_5]